MFEKLKSKRIPRPWGYEDWIHEGDILVKWIAAREHLSVQNHPREPGRSKREAWYFLDAPASGRVVTGWAGPLHGSPQMEYTSVASGDILELPAGAIHALTAGSLVLEIQEPLDETYRIYDWGRGRELRIEDAERARTSEPVKLYRPHLSVGKNRIIDRKEFTIEILVGPVAATLEHPAVIAYVEGARKLEAYLASEMEVASGERAILTWRTKPE